MQSGAPSLFTSRNVLAQHSLQESERRHDRVTGTSPLLCTTLIRRAVVTQVYYDEHSGKLRGILPALKRGTKVKCVRCDELGAPLLPFTPRTDHQRCAHACTNRDTTPLSRAWTRHEPSSELSPALLVDQLRGYIRSPICFAAAVSSLAC
jgi:hypothetical protein